MGKWKEIGEKITSIFITVKFWRANEKYSTKRLITIAEKIKHMGRDGHMVRDEYKERDMDMEREGHKERDMDKYFVNILMLRNLAKIEKCRQTAPLLIFWVEEICTVEICGIIVLRH